MSTLTFEFTMRDAWLVRDALGDMLCTLRRAKRNGAQCRALPRVEVLYREVADSVRLSRNLKAITDAKERAKARKVYQDLERKCDE